MSCRHAIVKLFPWKALSLLAGACCCPCWRHSRLPSIRVPPLPCLSALPPVLCRGSVLLGFEQANRYTIYDQHGASGFHISALCWAPVLPRLAATCHVAPATKPPPSPAAHLLAAHLFPVGLPFIICMQATLWRCWLRIWAPLGARWAGSCCAHAAPSPPLCSAPTVSCLQRRHALIFVLELEQKGSPAGQPANSCATWVCTSLQSCIHCRLCCCRPGHLHPAPPHVPHQLNNVH